MYTECGVFLFGVLRSAYSSSYCAIIRCLQPILTNSDTSKACAKVHYALLLKTNRHLPVHRKHIVMSLIMMDARDRFL